MAWITAKLSPYLFRRGWRAYRDTFRFSGRARRLEAGEFYIVSMALMLTVGLVADSGLQINAGSPAETYLAGKIGFEVARMLVLLPMFALMARRIQDFDLPGWLFAPLMIYLVAINEWKSLAVLTAAYPSSTWKSLAFLAPTALPPWQLEALGLPIALAVMIAFFIPGTIGPNRYGPDPRIEPSEPVQATA